jgi:hypothetical protein
MQGTDADQTDNDNRGNVADEQPLAEASSPDWAPAPVAVDEGEGDVVDGDVVQEVSAPPVLDIEDAPQAESAPAPAPRPTRGGRGRGRGRAKAGDDGSAASADVSAAANTERAADRRPSRKEAGASKGRKAPAKPRAARTRARKDPPTS